MKSILLRSFKEAHVIGIFVLALACLQLGAYSKCGNAQDARIAKSMAALKDQTTKLGAPKIDGIEEVGGRDAPALYFGSTKMNDDFSRGRRCCGGRRTRDGMETLFVKSGDDYIRVATNVSTRIGRRGLGTILTGAALELIKGGNAYYGKTSILGTPYVSGYEPIKDASGATIGVYFVGYTK